MARQADKDRKTLDFSFHLTDPTGKQVDTKTAGGILADLLMRAVLKDESKIVKYFDWASALTKTGIIEVDRGDEKELKNFITENENLFVLAKAPMLRKFDEKNG